MFSEIPDRLRKATPPEHFTGARHCAEAGSGADGSPQGGFTSAFPQEDAAVQVSRPPAFPSPGPARARACPGRHPAGPESDLRPDRPARSRPPRCQASSPRQEASVPPRRVLPAERKPASPPGRREDDAPTVCAADEGPARRALRGADAGGSRRAPEPSAEVGRARGPPLQRRVRASGAETVQRPRK